MSANHAETTTPCLALRFQTVGRLRAVLGKALDHAERRNLMRRNVARFTHVPSGSSTTRGSLSPEQAKRLLAAV